jgi:hypothetical protein
MLTLLVRFGNSIRRPALRAELTQADGSILFIVLGSALDKSGTSGLNIGCLGCLLEFHSTHCDRQFRESGMALRFHRPSNKSAWGELLGGSRPSLR